MKRSGILFSALVFLLSEAAPAGAAGLDISYGLGAGLGYLGQTYQSGMTFSATSVDLDATVAYGDRVGLFMNADAGLPLGAQLGGSAVDLTLYATKFSADMMAGIFYQLPLGNFLSAMVGVGPHLAYVFFMSSSYLGTPLMPSFMAGAGLYARARYMLSDSIGFFVGLKGAYDFLQVAGFSADTLTSGFGLAAGAGVSIALRL